MHTHGFRRSFVWVAVTAVMAGALGTIVASSSNIDAVSAARADDVRAPAYPALTRVITRMAQDARLRR